MRVGCEKGPLKKIFEMLANKNSIKPKVGRASPPVMFYYDMDPQQELCKKNNTKIPLGICALYQFFIHSFNKMELSYLCLNFAKLC